MSFPNVLFLVGPDRFQQKIWVDDLKKQVFPNGSGGLNDDRFDAKEKNAADAVDLCNTLPMFASHRFVLIRNFDKLNEESQELWCHYLAKPSPSTVLIFTAEKADKRTRFFKAIDKLNAVRETNEPKPRELGGWIQRLSKNHGVKILGRAEEALADTVGTNLGLLDQQIQKLALYVHPKTEITEKDVTELVLQAAGDNVFAWTDQVLDGKTREATETLAFLLQSGDPPLVLVSLLARHLRILLKAHDLIARRAGPSEFAPVLGVPPFVVARYMDQAKKHTKTKLAISLAGLATLDRELKSTGLPAQFLLEKTVRSISGRISL